MRFSAEKTDTGPEHRSAARLDSTLAAKVHLTKASAPAILHLRQPTGWQPAWQKLQGYIALTKPRIVLMLLFTAYAAMWAAAGHPGVAFGTLLGEGSSDRVSVAAHLPGLRVTVATLAGLALSTGGGAAVNM